MPSIPREVSTLLDDLTGNLSVILGRNLVGLYLHGSLTQRAFNPKRSDVDVLVVTQKDVTIKQLREMRIWLAEAAKSNEWGTALADALSNKE